MSANKKVKSLLSRFQRSNIAQSVPNLFLFLDHGSMHYSLAFPASPHVRQAPPPPSLVRQPAAARRCGRYLSGRSVPLGVV